MFLFAGFLTFSLCALTHPGILTIGVPTLTVTGTAIGTASEVLCVQIRASLISLIVALLVLIVLTSLIWNPSIEILSTPPKNAKINKIATDPQPAMPDECKVPGDAVQSYRNYYVMKKRRFATWKAPSTVPEWYAEAIQNGV